MFVVFVGFCRHPCMTESSVFEYNSSLKGAPFLFSKPPHTRTPTHPCPFKKKKQNKQKTQIQTTNKTKTITFCLSHSASLSIVFSLFVSSVFLSFVRSHLTASFLSKQNNQIQILVTYNHKRKRKGIN